MVKRAGVLHCFIIFSNTELCATPADNKVRGIDPLSLIVHIIVSIFLGKNMEVSFNLLNGELSF